MRLIDLQDAPNWNKTAVNKKIVNLHDGSVKLIQDAPSQQRAMRGVSLGLVSLHPAYVVSCKEHGAMNSTIEEGTVWRCFAVGCGAAGYLERS